MGDPLKPLAAYAETYPHIAWVTAGSPVYRKIPQLHGREQRVDDGFDDRAAEDSQLLIRGIGNTPRARPRARLGRLGIAEGNTRLATHALTVASNGPGPMTTSLPSSFVGGVDTVSS